MSTVPRARDSLPCRNGGDPADAAPALLKPRVWRVRRHYRHDCIDADLVVIALQATKVKCRKRLSVHGGETLGEVLPSRGHSLSGSREAEDKGVWREGPTPGVRLGRQKKMIRLQRLPEVGRRESSGRSSQHSAWFEGTTAPSTLCSGDLSCGGLWVGVLSSCGPPPTPRLHLHPPDRWEREAGKRKEREEEEHIFISNTVGVGEVGRNLV